MRKKVNGGIETIVAIVVVLGLVVALIATVVVDTSKGGDELIDAATDTLVKHQQTIGF